MTQVRVPVEEFTTPHPVTASEDATTDELNLLMTEHGIRHIPIKRGENIVGIVSDRDLRVISGLDIREKALVCARDIMIADPVTVSSDATLDEVALKMSSLKIGSVLVNEGNSFLGIFTATDALNALIEVSRGMPDGR